MESLAAPAFWVTLGEIIMVNIVLSGDNAVVIAMASRSLPARQRRKAIFFGSAGAIALRLVLTFAAAALLDLPWLKIAGAVLLAWIGIRMLMPEDGDDEVRGHAHLWSAIRTIIVADLIMSLDNVLGVAAAAKGSFLLLTLGLAISIPIIVYGSTLVVTLMNRFPVIVTAGGGVLGWVAGEMLAGDPAIRDWVEAGHTWLHVAAPVAGAVIVIAVGKARAVSRPS